LSDMLALSFRGSVPRDAAVFSGASQPVAHGE